MKKLDDELLNLENNFNSLKKKIEKFHITFIIIYFFIITLTIFIFQKYFINLYNIFYIKIILYSFMLLGLLIHYFLRFKFHKNKDFYGKFFKIKLKEIQKNFSNKRNFNKSVVDYIIKNLKNNKSQFSKKDLYDLNFWGLLIKDLGIDPDEIIKDL